MVLDVLNASWAPWPDAWIFVGTLVAFAAQGRGLVEFWLVWLAVDIVGVPLQLHSHLWFSAAVYLVFAYLVVRGFLLWSRSAERTGSGSPRAVHDQPDPAQADQRADHIPAVRTEPVDSHRPGE